MLDAFIVLLIGFTVIGLVILLVAYLGFFHSIPKTRSGAAACAVLCLVLMLVQLQHLRHLQTGAPLFESWYYLTLLLVLPPAFYFFSRDTLQPGRSAAALDVLHGLPVVTAMLLPIAWVAPLAFVIGAGYSVWLARMVYGMRRSVRRFRFEMFFFGMFAVIALLVLALIALVPWLGAAAFYRAYAIAIALAVALVMAALLIFPDLLTDIREVASLSYANSTLRNVNVDASLATLDRLMTTEAVYRNENLSLNLLAEAAGLSSHQLSELINTRFGVGFSRYLRERRIDEAKRQLQQDARSSVLSIGLGCGFGSQSSFYAAFREVVGESPAAFRKRHSGDAVTPE